MYCDWVEGLVLCALMASLLKNNFTQTSLQCTFLSLAIYESMSCAARPPVTGTKIRQMGTRCLLDSPQIFWTVSLRLSWFLLLLSFDALVTFIMPPKIPVCQSSFGHMQTKVYVLCYNLNQRLIETLLTLFWSESFGNNDLSATVNCYWRWCICCSVAVKPNILTIQQTLLYSFYYAISFDHCFMGI